LAGAEEVVSHYSSFGEYFGLAFQIVDDILGIWGREDFTGKPVADDIRSRKKTLPIVYALEREGTLKRSLIEIYRKEEIGGGDVEEVLAILDGIGARQYAEGVAIRYYRLALEELASTGIENESQDSLRELSQFIIERINQSWKRPVALTTF
jgi:geranylgeranyl diphosphate synthase type I